jgi:hypothetical protein
MRSPESLARWRSSPLAWAVLTDHYSSDASSSFHDAGQHPADLEEANLSGATQIFLAKGKQAGTLNQILVAKSKIELATRDNISTV